MNLDKYSTIASDEYKYFEFYSDGPKGRIRKVVIYRKPIGRHGTIFNLAFGDWDEKHQG